MLYPHSTYIANDVPNDIFLHNRFNVNDWCINCHNVKSGNYSDMNFNYNDFNPENPYYFKTNCRTCSYPYNSWARQNKMYQLNNKIINKYDRKNRAHVFPSQNTFVCKTPDEYDEYEKIHNMDEFAIYPSIKKYSSNETKINTIGIANNSSTDNSSTDNSSSANSNNCNNSNSANSNNSSNCNDCNNTNSTTGNTGPVKKRLCKKTSSLFV
jgi:hypothetical protein